ncbi:uncharacterized protein LOC131658032 [Vicia villosa]|uniref:uncharacterized protein LOC131658032 n=1 Tax=Vicia villosa TaxID=3911 RepID=UPI00273B53FE|nr:uncharacterized protein LOC131658032 [Vicia villosa]
MPPKIRKFDSGYEKRKKKRLDELTQSQSGAPDKFIIKEPQIPNENQNVDVGIIENMVSTENMEENTNANATENDNLDAENMEENANVNATENDNLDVENMEENANVNATENDDLDVENIDAENLDNASDNGEDRDIFDPAIWDSLESRMIDLLATKGPKRDLSIVKGPKDKSFRRFTANLYTRVLPNGEKCDRDWLVYSKKLDKVFCFCCKIFIKGIGRGQLANEGFCTWKHVGERLREHETCIEHVHNMTI